MAVQLSSPHVSSETSQSGPSTAILLGAHRLSGAVSPRPLPQLLEPRQPPPILFHGTAEKSLAAIRGEGLKPGQRQHVHLSPDEQTAVIVGSRHGCPVVLRIAAGRMRERGHAFFLSTNGVWLTDCVPSQFIQFPNETI